MRRRAFVFTRIVLNERARNTVTCVRMLPSQGAAYSLPDGSPSDCDDCFFPYDAPKKFHYAIANTSRINFISRFFLGYFVRLYKINLARMRLLDDTRVHAHLSQQLLPIYFRLNMKTRARTDSPPCPPSSLCRAQTQL